MASEVAVVVISLVVSAVVLSAAVVLCATKPKQEVPIGASMANRRGAAAMGKVQIDPLLQPDWAAKQAALEAQRRQQNAVYVSSKSLRVKNAGGGDEQLQVVMRQPSTMADKYALPSHLTKQLGQPSRRGLLNPNDSSIGQAGGLDPSASARHGREGAPYCPSPPLYPKQSPSPSLRRPEQAYTDTASGSCTRSGHIGCSGSAELAAQQPPSNAPSRRMAASPLLTAPSRMLASSEAPELAADAACTSIEAFQLEGSEPWREIGCDDLELPVVPPPRQLPDGVVWPGLNDPKVLAQAADSAGAGAASQAVGLGRPPRANHPRVAALGSSSRSTAPMPPSGRRSGSVDGSDPTAAARNPNMRPNSDVVDHLVSEIDWTSTVHSEGGRRVSSAMGGARTVAPALPREQSSAPSSTDVRLMLNHQAALAGGQAAGRGAASVGHTISGRGAFVRAPSRLASPLVGGVEPLDNPPTEGDRWVVPYSGMELDGAQGTSLPGSAEMPFFSPVVRVPDRDSRQRAEVALRAGGSVRVRGSSVSTEENASAAVVHASFRSLGGGGSASRVVATWNGMASQPGKDAEAGGSRLSADTTSLSGVSGRAARAQVLLARNKSNLSRLAAAAGNEMADSART